MSSNREISAARWVVLLPGMTGADVEQGTSVPAAAVIAASARTSAAPSAPSWEAPL